MAVPGSVPKVRSFTPKAKPLMARPHAASLAPNVGQDAGDWDRYAPRLRTWCLTDADWDRFGGINVPVISWSDA
eukprot:75648-Heterocapsa_arctica.AAC.1